MLLCMDRHRYGHETFFIALISDLAADEMEELLRSILIHFGAPDDKRRCEDRKAPYLLGSLIPQRELGACERRSCNAPYKPSTSSSSPQMSRRKGFEKQHLESWPLVRGAAVL